jgi:hypothetical protein
MECRQGGCYLLENASGFKLEAFGSLYVLAGPGNSLTQQVSKRVNWYQWRVTLANYIGMWKWHPSRMCTFILQIKIMHTKRFDMTACVRWDGRLRSIGLGQMTQWTIELLRGKESFPLDLDYKVVRLSCKLVQSVSCGHPELRKESILLGQTRPSPTWFCLMVGWVPTNHGKLFLMHRQK